MRIGVVRTGGSPCRCAESVICGLEALGYEAILADSAEIEAQALVLAESCDFVIDHTDTFHGRGLFRPLVRLLLENCGARVVGSDARACLLADNKSAAKTRLAEAGIPVPPGIVVGSKTWDLPSWLRPPLVIKPAFEHMSRGVQVVHTKQEAHAAVAQLLETMRQPVLVESYIRGRELAVSLLAGAEGLQMLPPLEWVIETGETGILTEKFKLMDPVGGTAALRPPISRRTSIAILRLWREKPFNVLGLRDYGRLDIRLSPGGTPFFLEANTTPSLEPLEALAVSAQWAGLEYPALVDRMLSAARNRHQSSLPAARAPICIPFPKGDIELEVVEGVWPPPLSTIELAGLLDIQPGDQVLELGCGSGLLSIAAAKLGAGRVVATDLNPRALHAAERNALRNGVSERIEFYAGSWYEALGSVDALGFYAERFDVILATPPQTPGPQPFGPKYGGPDGTIQSFQNHQGRAGIVKSGAGKTMADGYFAG